MGILSGNPKEEPMHYGEVAGAWYYLAVTKGCLSAYQTFLNHAGDKDLKNFIEDTIQNVTTPEIKEIEALLKDNGIIAPPSIGDKPSAEWEKIPVGARFTDMEISATIAKNLAEGLVACSTIIAQSTREDIIAMFGQLQMKTGQQALTLLRMNKQKGWLIPPPLHLQTPEMVEA